MLSRSCRVRLACGFAIHCIFGHVVESFGEGGVAVEQCAELRVSEGGCMIDHKHLRVFFKRLGGVHFERIRLLIVEDLEVLLCVVHFVGDFVVQLRDKLHRELGTQQLYTVEVVEILGGRGQLFDQCFSSLCFHQH
jgi:hypothetical protein